MGVVRGQLSVVRCIPFRALWGWVESIRLPAVSLELIMTSRNAVLGVLLQIMAASVASAQPAGPVPQGEVTKYAFNSSKIYPGTVRDYWVYVPKQYEPAKPACVHVNQDGIQFNAPAVLDELIHKKEMPVTIGVFVMP